MTDLNDETGFSQYFDFKTEEARLYQNDLDAGHFKAGANKEGDNPDNFCILIPPPNVTGSLHMGHALNNTLQDILVRYNRMQGKNVLWQVGCDHAGIATQAIVERQLDAQGVKKSDLGREAFIEKIWDWKAESGGTIIDQLKRLGASADFSRERFTMDQGLSDAVIDVFIKLHQEGLIYKDKRLVNWDCHLQTAISDLEVVSTDIKGSLWHFKYAIEGSDETIIIATTRPETMFGDSAIAVNPEDERYQHLLGKMAIIPCNGRKIPIIADNYADPEMGTGAVKITPAHDFNDFEVGQRHNLPMINILNKDGTLNDNVPADYQNMDRLLARKKLIKALMETEILTEIKPHPTKIPYGDRSNTVIEPFLTDQWYVDVKPLAEKALEFVEKEEINFTPPNWKKTYDNWLKDIQPWCISRQLWWGHQIPAWYDENGNFYVAKTLEEAQKQAGKGVTLTQDPDVLDTWFSSALWPMTTLDFFDNATHKPDETLYLSNVLITGFDIIFFWVARMVMMTSYVTDQSKIKNQKILPFKDIYIHALVRDEKGQKMSKSKGNVINPLELIDAYGADAVRFTLTAMAAQGRDIKLSKQRVEGYRNFGTKLWNASKFANSNGCKYDPTFDPTTTKLALSHWIVEKLNVAIDTTHHALNAYRFNDYANGLYHFVWNDMCDHFIEMAKPLLSSDDVNVKAEIQNVTAYILRCAYILLHPVMPFITEKLAEITTHESQERLIFTKLPEGINLTVSKAQEIDIIVALITDIRSLRVSLNVPASAKLMLNISDTSSASQIAINSNQEIINRMARVILNQDDINDGNISFVSGYITAKLGVGKFIDIPKEKERLSKELEKTAKDIGAMEGRLSNANFVARAQPEVIDETKQRLSECQDIKQKLQT
ncbi:MAG: valyl-tRNA synthetase, partial [Alphaproteobacteria bacterium]